MVKINDENSYEVAEVLDLLMLMIKRIKNLKLDCL